MALAIIRLASALRRAGGFTKAAGVLTFLAAVVAALIGVQVAAAARVAPRFHHPAIERVAGRAGELLRVEPLPYSPYGAAAYRVLYVSTGLDGRPVQVSGMVIVPLSSPPPGGRDIVAWGHPTTGVAPRCAPSLQSDPFYTIPGLETFIARGDIVTATDYPGLGTGGPHPYLVGISEGRAILDSVRAAQQVPGAMASRRFAVWGHSQGGQGGLFAGEIAARYAPDLALVGVAVAAPATHLGVLMENDITSISGRTLSAYTLWSWSHVYGVPLTNIVGSEAMPTVENIVRDCVQTNAETLGVGLVSIGLGPHFLLADPTRVEPWRALIARNNPGSAPPGAPVFIAQGTNDLIVRPAVTAEFAAQLCRRGAKVRFVTLPFVEHMGAARAAAHAAADWITDRFLGHPAPSDCGSRMQAAAE